MAEKIVKEVTYKVTTAFGDSEENELRKAYVIAGLSEGGSVMLFHPKDGRFACGSLEMAKKEGDVYVSLLDEDAYVALPKTQKKLVNSVVDSNSYCNLSSKEEKLYRSLVESQLGPIPKVLIISRPSEDVEITPKKKVAKKGLKLK